MNELLVWSFSVIVLFINPEGGIPLFGNSVQIVIKAESEEACNTLKKIILKQMTYLRHNEPTECQMKRKEE